MRALTFLVAQPRVVVRAILASEMAWMAAERTRRGHRFGREISGSYGWEGIKASGGNVEAERVGR